MANRTLVIGDIHGALDHLQRLLSRLPTLDASDTLVFLGDYIDRGPDSAGVVDHVRNRLPGETAAKIVCLRGNHEDAWLRVRHTGWPEFVIPPNNGCLACLRSFRGDGHWGAPTADEVGQLLTGAFFPADVVAWFEQLLWWYEDEHAIYVHAGLHARPAGGFLHPSETIDPTVLVWTRSREFFKNYRGKRVVVGHTTTSLLPPELSVYTPDDPSDLWAGPSVIAIDTGCGKPNGFLSAVELPAGLVYESRT